MSILIAILLIAAFVMGAVYEHLESEDGIVKLATEDANEEGDVELPKIWMFGMLPFFLGFLLLYARLSDVYVLAAVSSISMASLLADLTNTNSSWERTIGVIAVVSVVISTILVILVMMYGSFDLITNIIIAGVASQSFVGGQVLIGLYVYYRSNYFEYTGSMKNERR